MSDPLKAQVSETALLDCGSQCNAVLISRAITNQADVARR